MPRSTQLHKAEASKETRMTTGILELMDVIQLSKNKVAQSCLVQASANAPHNTRVEACNS